MHPDPIPISALQHYLFCPRQCALIHVEGLWAENRLTVEGQILHKRAHGESAGPRRGGRVEARGRKATEDSNPEPDESSLPGPSPSHLPPPDMPGCSSLVPSSPSARERRRIRIVRGLSLCSEPLGLVGKADVVEFHETPGTEHSSVPFPVEYKRGKPKKHEADVVQLCAQALCLESMLSLPPGGVPAGAMYYGKLRHRVDVPFDRWLRSLTLNVIAKVREMIASGITPRAKREKKCERCSLLNLCLPSATSPNRSAQQYIDDAVELKQ